MLSFSDWIGSFHFRDKKGKIQALTRKEVQVLLEIYLYHPDLVKIGEI